jgi:hypothetical protein
LKGYWFNRTKEGAARRRGEAPERLAYASEEEVVLSPLPCWEYWHPFGVDATTKSDGG